MAPKSPSEIIEASSPPADSESALPAYPQVVNGPTEAIIQALNQHGWKTADVKRRDVPYFWKVSWEELCNLHTQDPKVMASPVLAIVNVVAMPDAPQEFEAYQGMVRAEFFAEDGGAYAITHSYSYVETGELTPLSAWLTATPTPFWARIGYVETRKEGRHVVRPLPLDIEVR